MTIRYQFFFYYYLFILQIYTLLSCFITPQKDDKPHFEKSMYMSFAEDYSSSVYESAIAQTKHHDITKNASVKHLSSEVANIKLLQGQIIVDEVLLDVASKGIEKVLN